MIYPLKVMVTKLNDRSKMSPVKIRGCDCLGGFVFSHKKCSN